VTVRRSRTVGAPPDAVWAVVGDPHHLPRWWPRVERVESVDADAWTCVMRTDRGSVVRADYRLVASDEGRRREWAQQLAGSPFERLLREHRTAVELAGDGPTEVTLTVNSRARGTARLGNFMMRRAQARQLDEALAALAEVVPAPADRLGQDGQR
jgi:uncharacterized protein YndB with AHSA1/START domain